MDGDIVSYQVPFNLEIMKLSQYYKKNNEIVILTNKFLPEKHTHFFYRKDYNDGQFPNFFSDHDLQYGGLAFTNNQYSPLPLEIEKMRPDTTIYSRFEKQITQWPDGKRIFHDMQDSEHIRLSLDGKTIWSEYGRQFKQLRSTRNIMLHDYDLANIEGARQEIVSILKKARTDGWATRLGTKFPIHIVNNGQELLDWTAFKTNQTFFGLVYDGVIPDEAFLEWISSGRERQIFSTVDYNVTPAWYAEDHFINVLLPKIFKQVIISRSYGVFFTLKYNKEFFIEPQWGDVLQLFNYYHNSYLSTGMAQYIKQVPTDTLFDFAKNSQKIPSARYHGKAFDKAQIREIFAFVRENQPELFDLFYNCSAEKLGGKL